jgi:photosystem II stability/assembly factor-like uncharacterized protein
VKSAAPRPDIIAVAPSSPGTLATCTGAAGQSAEASITLSISTEDGGSWQTHDTGIPLARCMGLAISPANASSIALYAGTCRSDCGQGYERLYLSSDGGSHWKQVTPSVDGDTGGVFGWVGTTFFANTAPDGTPPAATQYLAVSRDGIHFTWTSLPAVPGRLLTSGSTLYAVTGSAALCAAAGNCTDLYRSTDLGASWSRVTPTYQGNNVQALAVVQGDTTLLGFDARAFAGPNTYPLLRSVDGGDSWQPLANGPSGLQTDIDMPAVAPDGTVYVTFCCAASASSSATQGIYKLAPGAATWTLVSPVVPAQVRLVAVSWDTQGHPARLWGLRDAFPNTSAEITDLWSHGA